jgi:hypothetical protein
MEIKNGRIQRIPTLHFLTVPPDGGAKTRLMITRPNIIRFITFTFMVLVALALVYGIKARSATGVILSLTSLGAGIHFLVLLSKAKQQLQQEQEETA